MSDKIRTMKELAQVAMDIQNASNLSGVIHSFSKVITELRFHLGNELNFSTEMLNQHAIVRVFLDKMNSLARIQEDDNNKIFNAFNECDKLIKD